MNETKQRFVELEVNEVSVVDTPANEATFVVVKNLNQEVGEMATEQKNEGASAGTEQVAVETEKSESAAVEKAFSQVTDMIAQIAKAVDANKEGAEANEEQQSTQKSGDNTTEENAEAETPSIEDMVSKAMDDFALGIQKARAFTPTREAAFKAALEQLAALAKELGMTEIPVGQSPKTNTPGGTSFGASGTQQLTKALEGITATMQSIVETTKSLADRVEAVEKVRNPSQSLDNDGNVESEETETQKSKNLWSGIL
jgi:hypothetical protein